MTRLHWNYTGGVLGLLQRHFAVDLEIGPTIKQTKTLGVNVDNHFREVTKMIALAKGAQRDVQDFMLTRDA